MKKIISVIAAATLVLSLSACGGDDGGNTSSDGTVTFRIGSNWAASHPMAKAIDEVFVPMIEEESDGKLKAGLPLRPARQRGRPVGRRAQRHDRDGPRRHPDEPGVLEDAHLGLAVPLP